MPDAPRFQVVVQPFEEAYRHYHGAGVVTFVLSCADRWMTWRERRALARTEAQSQQVLRYRTDVTSNVAGRYDNARRGQTTSQITQAGARSASQNLVMFLVFLPVALAMISLQPNGAKAWGEVDTPSSKQSRLARHLVAIDAYDLVRRNAPQVLFLDVRTEPEVELLGVPRLIDGHVPFLLYATHPAGDGRRRGSQLMINADFVSTVGERLAAKALTTDSAVVLICADGTRSARAADVLAEAGFAQVYTIVDGFEGDQVAGATHSERRAINGWKLSRLPWFYPATPHIFSYTQASR
jgi:rhodanese-related sulfurtransferase